MMLLHLAFLVLADFVLLLHLSFVLFVAFGGLLVLRWPLASWAHLPCLFWGAVIELTGWTCPLTHVENSLRSAAGVAPYSGDFIGHVISATLYPPGLTRSMQLALALALIAGNALVYGIGMRSRHSPS